MQMQSGSSTALIASVVIIVLIALGVWWWVGSGSPGSSNAPEQSAPTGQLEGTVLPGSQQ